MSEINPGWKSSEFWVTALTLVGTILGTIFGVPKVESDNLIHAITSAVIAITALLASGVNVWKYISSRTALKAEAMKVDLLEEKVRMLSR